MPIIKYADLSAIEVQMKDALFVTKKVPIGATEGWDGYTMRTFVLAPGGHTPKHRHNWEHVNYVIKGKGHLLIGGVEHRISEKDFAFVPPDVEHQYLNPYDRDFEMICIVPNRGEY